MNCTYFTDLHVDHYSKFNTGISRLDGVLKVLDDVFGQANKRGSGVILFGGDFYNSTATISTVVEDAVIPRLAKLFNKYPNIIVYAISGNHDHATANLIDRDAVSAITHLSVVFPGRFVVIDNDVVQLPDSTEVYGIPYYRHKEHYQKILEDLVFDINEHPTTNRKILMIHQTPSGTGNEFLPVDTEVTDPLYDTFDMVLCGHIHTAQRLTDRFLLGGNPLHRDMGDMGVEKGMWFFDTADPAGTLKFLSRKGRYPEFRRAAPGELITGDETDFVTPHVTDVMVEDEAMNETIENFRNDLPAVELMTNFWALHSDDRELLEVGLSLLTA